MLQHYPDPGVDYSYVGSQRWWQAMTAPELRVTICYDEIEVFMFQRPGWAGSANKLLSHQQYRLTGNAEDMLPSEDIWPILGEILKPLAGRYLHIVVVLSNQYSRWIVLPWQSEIRSDLEKQAYYSHGLVQTFGLEMQEWKVQSQISGYGQSSLINAMPPGLTDRLMALFEEYRLTPGMIAPAWMFSANQVLHLIDHQKLSLDGWIISRESGSLTIGCLVNGSWQHIRQVAIDIHWREALHQFLLRALVVSPELTSLPVYISQAKLSGVSSQSLAPFTVIDVQPSQWMGEAFNQQLRRRLA